MAEVLVPNEENAAPIINEQAKQKERNTGLVWDRYLPVWNHASLSKPIEQHLTPFAKESTHTYAALDADQKRRKRALEALAESTGNMLIWADYSLVGPLALGLGASHPTENGFRFDYASGLPVIPGSAVKGLCRRAAALGETAPEDIARWFGPEEISATSPGYRGSLSFFDALPAKEVTLGVDIINNHHPSYYGKGNEAVLTETDSPVPVTYLVVKKGTFTFPVLAPPGDDQAVKKILDLGLNWLGVGAKTALGYGQFTPANGA